MHPPSRRSVHRCLTAAAFAATTAAFAAPLAAADFPVKAPPGPLVAPSWSGFYAGVHGGWGWDTTHISIPFGSPPFGTIEATTSGPLAGGQIGANWQYGNVVLGLELDGSWTFIRGNSGTNQGVITSTARDTIDFRALATATGRIGYAMGPWLAYAKGGGAWADVLIRSPNFAEPVTWERSVFGVAAGVGMEVAFLRNVSAKIEYNFLYFPPDHLVYFGNTDIPASSIDHFVQVVKAGINVRFGGGDQVLAR